MEPTAILLIIVAFAFGCAFALIMSKASSSSKGGANISKAPFSAGTPGSTVSGGVRLQDFRRLEAKVDLVMKELGLTLPDDPDIGPAQKSLSPEVLALLPDKKIEAIKLHRLQTGLGLKESKDMVDEAWREMNR